MPDLGRILIAGAGMSGLCLAHGLQAAGFRVTVFERDATPTERISGYRLHINPAGSRAMRACLPDSLWQAVVSSSGRPGPLTFFTEQQRMLLRIDESDGGRDPTETSHCVDRFTLRQFLLTGLADVRFGHRVTGFSAGNDGVTAFFADGTSERGNLLVAADGANSAVAGQFLPGAARRPATAFSIAFKVPLDDANREWLPAAFSAGMTLTSPPAQTSLFTSAFVRLEDAEDVADQLHRASGNRPICVSDPAGAYDDYVLCTLIIDQGALPPTVGSYDGPALRMLYVDHTGSWHPFYQRLVNTADATSFSLVAHRSSAFVPPWPTTRITVIGDAVHAMPPVGGLGGNAALRDAQLLTRTLVEVRDHGADLIAALRTHEQQVRRYGYAAIRTAEKAQRKGLRSGRFALTGQRWGMRMAAHVPAMARRAAPFRQQSKPVAGESATSITCTGAADRPSPAA
jgi:2-polyprenyl-6-methoxyphenol hydroxylase-like FAD-dependent oxidoreductase